MRITRVLVVVAALAAVAAPLARALAFDDYVKPPNGIQGQPYDFQFKARAGCTPVYYYSLYRGALPPGLELSRSGRISGVPTTPGSYTFTVQLESYYEGCTSYPSQRDFTIEIAPALIVTTTGVGFGIVGQPYGLKFQASGGGTQNWSVVAGQLPPGLTFGADGTLSGTPTTAGTWAWTVQVADASRKGTQQVSMEVVDRLAATAPAPKRSEVGVPFSLSLAATGGKQAYAWSTAGGSLPPGLELSGDRIAGTPTEAGTFVATLAVKDASGQTATLELRLPVAAELRALPLRRRLTKVGRVFQQTLRRAGGVAPVRWKVLSGRFPVGVRLDRATGVIRGVPRTAGTYELTFEGRDALGTTSETSLALTVQAAKKPKRAKRS